MGSARLSARPAATTTQEAFAPGTHALGLGDRRDALLVVPPSAAPGAPLVLGLHGAGGTGRQMEQLLAAEAARRGLLVLAPDSRGTTWDVIRGGYGPDVAFLNQALSAVLARFAVGPLAVSGFSDGASYALSIGLANGDLFGHVLAWSPGFMAPPELAGRPRVFVSHGTDDRVLPIDRCSRRLVPVLRADGYAVRYDEFDGGHVVPPGVLAASLDWFGAPLR
jgi:phospholipase/carboxylesterase